MVRLAENAGFGFDKIESNWYTYNKTKPEYKLEFDSVTTSFNLTSTYNNKITEQVTEQVKALILVLKSEMDRQEIQDKLGFAEKVFFIFNKPYLVLRDYEFHSLYFSRKQ